MGIKRKEFSMLLMQGFMLNKLPRNKQREGLNRLNKQGRDKLRILIMGNNKIVNCNNNNNNNNNKNKINNNNNNNKQ